MSSLRQAPARAKLLVERWRVRWPAFDIAVRTFKAFSLDDGGVHTAALTYYFFFSVFPLLLFAISLVGFLTFGNESLRADIISAGIDSVPLLKNILTSDVLTTIEERRQELALSGLALALYSGSGAIVALSHALNRINGVTEERNFVAKRLRSLALLAAFGVAVLVSLALGAVTGYADKLFDTSAAQIVTIVLGHLVGFGVGVLLFAAAFKVLPNKDLSLADVLPGAVTASVLFEVLKEFGAWYLQRGTSAREETFGTLAAAAGFLVASYLIAQIVLLAAELNDVLVERRNTRQSSTTGLQEEGQDG